MNDSRLATIYLVRHGEAASNAFPEKDHAFHSQWGEAGSPLTEKGEDQARERAKHLAHIHFDAVFSSDLTRAVQTAEILKLDRALAVQTTELIRERNYHDYIARVQAQGKTHEQIKQEMREALKDLDEKGKFAYKYGEGMESPEESMTRLLRFLREVAVAYAGKTILVVNHGNNMRSLLTHLGYAKFDELPNGTVKNTAYVVLESDGVDFFIKQVEGIEKQTGTVRTF